MFENTVKTT